MRIEISKSSVGAGWYYRTAAQRVSTSNLTGLVDALWQCMSHAPGSRWRILLVPKLIPHVGADYTVAVMNTIGDLADPPPVAEGLTPQQVYYQIQPYLNMLESQ